MLWLHVTLLDVNGETCAKWTVRSAAMFFYNKAPIYTNLTLANLTARLSADFTRRCAFTFGNVELKSIKVFFGQEPPSSIYFHRMCGNYQLLSVIY